MFNGMFNGGGGRDGTRRDVPNIYGKPLTQAAPTAMPSCDEQTAWKRLRSLEEELADERAESRLQEERAKSLLRTLEETRTSSVEVRLRKSLASCVKLPAALPPAAPSQLALESGRRTSTASDETTTSSVLLEVINQNLAVCESVAAQLAAALEAAMKAEGEREARESELLDEIARLLRANADQRCSIKSLMRANADQLSSIKSLELRNSAASAEHEARWGGLSAGSRLGVGGGRPFWKGRTGGAGDADWQPDTQPHKPPPGWPPPADWPPSPDGSTRVSVDVDSVLAGAQGAKPRRGRLGLRLRHSSPPLRHSPPPLRHLPPRAS